MSGTELSLVRGDRNLFENLSFALNAGEMMLVRGANGSGKTSLLRAIAGLLTLDRGYVSWQGARTDRNRQSFAAELVWMAHRVGFKADLTLTENLRFECGLRPSRIERLPGALARLKLAELAKLPLRALSAGQQRRVALARMLVSDAKLWLMDEPHANLDAAGQDLLAEMVDEHLAGGGVCVMAAHRDLAIAAAVHRIELT